MKSKLKWLAFLGKIAGLAEVFDLTPLSPTIGMAVFVGSSIIKDATNRIGDLLDDGKINQSFDTSSKQ